MSNSMMQITPAPSATNLIRNALATKNSNGGTGASIELVFDVALVLIKKVALVIVSMTALVMLPKLF
jgi:hypothetical protein